MNRFYYIDKPINISSFDIIRRVRKKLNFKKIGHTGTLDPLASGGVILATGRYTKLISYLNKDRKIYEFTINIDGITESFDLGEQVCYLDKKHQNIFRKKITKTYLNQILKTHFLGEIIQTPPKYSAIKINGKRAYSLARDGKQVDMKKRKITVFDIELLDYSYPEIHLRAEVSTGTYIRSIAMDLGNILGTGGYITKLRRTKIGNLDVSLAQDLNNFNKDNYLDIKKLFSHNNFITLDKNILEQLNNGMRVSGKFNFKIGEYLFVYINGEITNLVIYDGSVLIPKKKL